MLLYKKKRGFTLLETLMVVAIISILVFIALPNYYRMKEEEHNRDAGASMKLIIAAQKIYRMESAAWDVEYTGAGSDDPLNAAATADITNINTRLRLSLPSGANRMWNYRTNNDNTVVPVGTCAEVQRTTVGRVGATRTLRMRSNFSGSSEEEPVAGTCP